ncbi:MAG: GGDEF domain-containing protein, partial [Oscillospiraceae bacterium]
VLLENNKDVTLEPKEVERYLNISKLKLYMNRRDKENFHSLFLKLMVEFRENVNIDLTLDMLNDCLFWIKFGFIDEAKEFLGFCSNFIFDYNIKNLERIYYYAMIKVCEAEKNEKLKQEMIFKYYEIGEYIREDLQNINAENVKNKIALFELKKSMHKTEVAAMTDSLTQIYNRTSFNNLILKRFDVACKLNQQVGVIFIDIDWFKEFNDTFGHAQGDKCLQFVANEMKKNSKVLKDSMCIRYGGDEFLIITFNNSLNEVCELIKKIKDRITDRKMPNPLAKYKIVTISSGVCVEQVNNSSDIYSLIIKADRALYRSKEVKNTIEIAKPGS